MPAHLAIHEAASNKRFELLRHSCADPTVFVRDQLQIDELSFALWSHEFALSLKQWGRSGRIDDKIHLYDVILLQKSQSLVVDQYFPGFSFSLWLSTATKKVVEATTCAVTRLDGIDSDHFTKKLSK
jgi:hypothetical protein